MNLTATEDETPGALDPSAPAREDRLDDVRIVANDLRDAGKAALVERYVNGELADARLARDRRRRLLRCRIEPTNPAMMVSWFTGLATIGWLAGVVDCEWFPADIEAWA